MTDMAHHQWHIEPREIERQESRGAAGTRTSGWTPSDAAREFYGDRVAEMYSGSGGEGSSGDRLWRDLHVDPGDLVVEKTGPSAFFPGDCGLHGLLVDRASGRSSSPGP